MTKERRAGAKKRYKTKDQTVLLLCFSHLAVENHVLGHNGVGPITTAAVQEEGKDLPSQPVFPTGEHNIQRDEPVTTVPG